MSYPTHTGWEARIEGHVRQRNGTLYWAKLVSVDGEATREGAVGRVLRVFWRRSRSASGADWTSYDTRLMVRFIPEPPEWEWDKAASRKVGKSEWAEDTK